MQDGRLIALDAQDRHARCGKRRPPSPDDNRYITGAPRVFNGKVLIGHGGADFGHVRGYVTAYDAETGKQLWRWSAPCRAIPANGFENDGHGDGREDLDRRVVEVRRRRHGLERHDLRPRVQPRLPRHRQRLAVEPAKLRSPGGGDNLFLCSIVALDANTGEYVWHYQTTPGETWDFNSSQDMVLATLPIDGKPRKVLMHAPKNGFFYVIDRETGKLISAEKFAKVTWAERIDLATGRPVEAAGARYGNGETLIWPGTRGAHNWQPMSYSPDTKLVYIPGRELPGYYSDNGIDPKTWEPMTRGGMGVHSANDVPKDAGRAGCSRGIPCSRRKRGASHAGGYTTAA